MEALVPSTCYYVNSIEATVKHLFTNNLKLPHQVLEQLFRLRVIAIFSQTFTLMFVYFGLKIHLPLLPMFEVIAVTVLIAALTFWRIRQDDPVSELEVTLHLAIDTCMLAILLYFSGGFTNPFVSLFLVQIAIAASFLRRPYTITIVLLTMLLYSVLAVYFVPLSPQHGHSVDFFDIHLTGMWVGFILSAFITTTFVSLLASIARKREEKLARAREKMLNNEHLVYLGTLSAGVAHEINTPLSSIKMILTEMEHSEPADPWNREQLPILREQTEICIQRIRELTQAVQNRNSGNDQEQTLDTFVDTLIRRWTAMRPEISLQQAISIAPETPISCAQSLSQVVINLLNNAADASLENKRHEVSITFSGTERQLIVSIDDFGKGFSKQQLNQTGQLVSSTKESGLGVGLMLSHATLELLGGSLILQARGDGTRAEISIVLSTDKS